MQFEPKQLTHFAFISIMVYLMLLALPRNKVALPVLIFSLLCLSSMHIYKIITDYMSWKQDATSPVMLLVCKLSQLAYSYQDGEIIKNTPERIPRESKKLIVDKLPSLFEYLSFILFFPSVSIGPSFEYSDYIRYIKLQDEFKAIPDPFLSSLRVLGYSIIAIGLCVIGDIYFPFTYCTTEEYYQKEFLYKVLFFNIAMVFGRIKFTAAWKFAESAMIASGFGYTIDSNGKSSWNRAIAINWAKVEFGDTTKEMIDNWNMSVTTWIRKCVFNRISISGKDPEKPSSLRRSLAQHCSFIFSAFWHGFYPAYYIMFFFFSIHAEVSKMAYVSDFSNFPAKGFIKWIAWIMMWEIGNFLGIIFFALDLRLSIRFITSVYGFPIIQLVLAWAFFKVTGYHLRRAKKE